MKSTVELMRSRMIKNFKILRKTKDEKTNNIKKNRQ